MKGPVSRDDRKRAGYRARSCPLGVLLLVGAVLTPLRASGDAEPDLSKLSLEQLANLEVTSVTKAPQPLQQAPAAIYVITHDDIARSGVTSIAGGRLTVRQRIAIQLPGDGVRAAAGEGAGKVDLRLRRQRRAKH